MSNRSSDEIDLSYRPRTFFWADQMGVALSSSIKGAERKRFYEASALRGKNLPPSLSHPALSEPERSAWGRIHPWNMGGEYLPDREEDEVEIARIVIASTTQDVTSVYVRATADGLQYRVVDEYEGETLEAPSSRISTEPITLKELTDLFLGAWDLARVLDLNFGDGADPVKVHRFVLEASSDFYPGFDRVVRSRIDGWLRNLKGSVERGTS